MRSPSTKTTLSFITLNLLFCMSSFTQDPCRLLSNNWVFEKTSINGLLSIPGGREPLEKLSLYLDMTYEKFENGVYSSGVWCFSNTDNHLILQNKHSEETTVLTVVKASDKQLILKPDDDWKVDVRIYLKPDPKNPVS